MSNATGVPKEPTADELEAEKLLLEEAKVDEIKEKVIKDLGLDPDIDNDLIDKITTSRVEAHKTLSTAIGQKIKLRESLKDKPTGSTGPTGPAVENKTGEVVDVKTEIAAQLEAERLEDMDYPDELKTEIKKVANMQKISVKKALQDPYIVFKIDEMVKDGKIDSASIENKKKANTTVNLGGKEGFEEAPPKVDLSTKEGRDEYNKWKEGKIKQEKENKAKK